jgi:hypothetical protein
MAQGIKGASKKAALQSKLSQLDSFGTSKDSVDKKLSVIENIAGDFIERIKSNIEEKEMIVTGKIDDITIQSEDGVVNIYAVPYLLYQDRGVSGTQQRYNTPHKYTNKMPPVEVFEKYIKTKNIQLRDEKKHHGKGSPFAGLTDDEKIRKAAWGMAKNIQKKGIKPKYIYSKEIPKLVSDLQDALGDFAIEQITQQIDVKDSAKEVILKM